MRTEPRGTVTMVTPASGAPVLTADQVRQSLNDDELRAIRQATRFQWALGSDAYRRFVEMQTQRRASRLPMGRPRRSAKVVSDLT